MPERQSCDSFCWSELLDFVEQVCTVNSEGLDRTTSKAVR